MVVDTLDNLEKYASLNPLFAQAIAYVKSHDLHSLPIGKTVLEEGRLWVTVSLTKAKTKGEARLETHRDFIDIQIPLSITEVMGYTPAADCPPADAPYNAEKDITYFTGPSETYLTIKPGMFAIFFPQDGHAPCIATEEIKKIVIKVKA
ncbi:MAG: YhcH/YjgK/YiaL family protein [Mediterranea sp.]|jgi:YhcH/YjgK/YiaL family protein|nr:YhcH/YjgK/YiaL family protein [Mediterranea sp.]